MRSRFLNIILAFSLILAVYMPTSVAGESISARYLVILSALSFAALLMQRELRPSFIYFPIFGLIPALIAFFSFFSGFNHFNFKILYGYSLLALLFLVRLQPVHMERWQVSLFAALNTANIIFGIGIVIGNNAIEKFIDSYYSCSDSEWLFSQMIALHKPIGTFCIHSTAGFMMYLFFYASLKTFELKNRQLFLWFSIFYVILIAALTSVTGLTLAMLGAAHIAYVLWKTQRPVFALALVAVVIAIPPSLGASWSDIKDAAGLVASSSENGLAGRFNSNGTMYNSMQYVIHHPLRPIGASDREELFTGDSGLVEFALRGSVLMLVFVHVAYFLFLRQNLVDKQDAWLLFVLTIAFEMGAAVLLYIRFIWLLPFFCFYLNSLQRPWQNEAPSMKRVNPGPYGGISKSLDFRPLRRPTA